MYLHDIIVYVYNLNSTTAYIVYPYICIYFDVYNCKCKLCGPMDCSSCTRSIWTPLVSTGS